MASYSLTPMASSLKPMTSCVSLWYWYSTDGSTMRRRPSSTSMWSHPYVVVFTMIVIAFVGTAIGQRVLGWLGDQIGRRRVYRFRLIIVGLSSIACGFSKCSSRNSVLVSLGLYRFVLGVGIGVDYPFSANESGTFISALFSKQFLDILGLLAVTMEVCAMFDRAFDRVDPTPKETDIAWTWTVMLTAIPAALTFYKTPKAARYINKFYTNCIPMQCTGKQLKIRSKEYIFRYWFSLFDT